MTGVVKGIDIKCRPECGSGFGIAGDDQGYPTIPRLARALWSRDIGITKTFWTDWRSFRGSESSGEYIRSDNGSEFTAQAVRDWLKAVGVKTLYIETGSPLENRCVESFNGKLRDELLIVEAFDTLWEAKVLAERWRREYNQRRPHSALGYRPPAPEAFLPRAQAGNSSPWAGLQIIPALT